MDEKKFQAIFCKPESIMIPEPVMVAVMEFSQDSQVFRAKVGAITCNPEMDLQEKFDGIADVVNLEIAFRNTNRKWLSNFYNNVKLK